MFYHTRLYITGISTNLVRNRTKEQTLLELVCPFVNGDVTLWQGSIFNMSTFGSMRIFSTNRPIDSDWPVKAADFSEGSDDYKYRDALEQYFLSTNDSDVTIELYAEAVQYIEQGRYKQSKLRIQDSLRTRTAFMITPVGIEDVDHNYEFVIKPVLEKHQFSITRADEISDTQTITDTIIHSINSARLIVADLTDNRPNCYYEIGYAHALKKPVIILARDGTHRHFDISTYKWIYWTDYRDLKPQFEAALTTAINKFQSSNT